MEADIICSVLVMRYLSGRNTCFLSLANVYFGCVWADADIAAGLFACAFQAAFYVPHIPYGK